MQTYLVQPVTLEQMRRVVALMEAAEQTKADLSLLWSEGVDENEKQARSLNVNLRCFGVLATIDSRGRVS